jgi:hypothetical protein
MGGITAAGRGQGTGLSLADAGRLRAWLADPDGTLAVAGGQVTFAAVPGGRISILVHPEDGCQAGLPPLAGRIAGILAVDRGTPAAALCVTLGLENRAHVMTAALEAMRAAGLARCTENGLLWYLAPPPADLAAHLLGALTRYPHGMTAFALAAALGVPEAQARAALTGLCRDGLVIPASYGTDRDWQWFPASSGERP